MTAAREMDVTRHYGELSEQAKGEVAGIVADLIVGYLKRHTADGVEPAELQDEEEALA